MRIFGMCLSGGWVPRRSFCKGEVLMYEEKIKSVVAQFAEEIKGMFGNSLHNIILYGSCARGDFTKDSDIDLMILLDIPREDFIRFFMD